MNRRQLLFSATAAALAPALPVEAAPRDLNKPLPDYWWEFDFAQGEKFCTYGQFGHAIGRSKEFGMGLNVTRIRRVSTDGKCREWNFTANGSTYREFNIFDDASH